MQDAIKMPVLGKDPPTRYRVYTWGVNLTEKGPVYLTEKSAKKIMDEFYRRGNVLTFNINHNEADVTLGHFKLDLKPDGVWMDPIQWTPKGEDILRQGEIIYISPEINYLETTNEVVAITGMALTNNPATNHLKPLLLTLKGSAMDDTPTEDMSVHPLKQMLTGLQVAMGCAQDTLSGNQGMMDEDMKGMLTDGVEMMAGYSSRLMDCLEKMGVAKETHTDTDEPKAGEVEPVTSTPSNSEDFSLPASVNATPVKSEEEPVTNDESQGRLLAAMQNHKTAQEKLKKAETREMQLMIELGVAQRKIAPAEKDQYLRMSKKQLTAFLANRTELEEENTDEVISERNEPLEVKTLSLPQADLNSLRSTFKKLNFIDGPLLTTKGE